jgi:hypothetical protein
MIVEGQPDKSLLIVEGVPLPEDASSSPAQASSKLRILDFEGELNVRHGYGCPFCRGDRFIKCGSCSKFCCGKNDEDFVCPSCGLGGQIRIMKRFKADVTGAATAPGGTAPPVRSTSTSITISPGKGITRT